jgi:uncharacterized membrane protein
MWIRRSIISCVALLAILAAADKVSAQSANVEIKVAKPGQNITLWYGWNVRGQIFLKIDAGPGEDCMEVWWIRAGVNSDSWIMCNSGTVPYNLPFIYGELRAGHFKKKTAVAVSSFAGVAAKYDLCRQVLKIPICE